MGEMVSADGLVRGNQATLDYIAFEPHERPIGIQLFGSEPGVMAAGQCAITRKEPEEVSTS